MTLVMLWIEDRGGRQYLNIASDSLLTQAGTTNRWENATKVFQVSPSDVFMAYCGDSLPGLHAIMQGTAILNSSATLGAPSGPSTPQVQARASAIKNHLEGTLPAVPKAWGKNIELVMAGWDFRKKDFQAFRLKLANGLLGMERIPLSTGPFLFGSGSTAAKKLLKGKALTRENVLRVLQAVIHDKKQPEVGGTPQMVCIPHGGGPSRPVAFRQRRNSRTEFYLYGIPLRFKSELRRLIFLDGHFRPTRYSKSGTLKRVTERHR